MTRNKFDLTSNMSKDDKPAVCIGHISLNVVDLEESLKFFEDIGMRRVARNDQMAILELRGGTHLILMKSSSSNHGGPGITGFDLMVEKLESMHSHLIQKGYTPGPIKPGSHHSVFEIEEPSGFIIQVSDSHVVGNV